jgi:hypothetical protein
MKQIIFILLASITISCNNHTDELKAISEDIQASFDKGDLKYVSNLVAYNRLFEEAYLELQIPYEYTHQLTRQFKKAYTLERILSKMKGKDGKLRVISNDDKKITIGIYQGLDTFLVNYIDLKLLKYKSGWRIMDYYYYSLGLSVRDEMASLAKQFKEDRGNPLFIKFGNTISKVKNAIRRRDYSEALAAFEEIPEEFHERQQVKGLALVITTHLFPDNVDPLIESYMEENPEAEKFNAYLKFIGSVYHTRCGEMDDAIHELWKYTGVDSFLLKYREDCVVEM